MARRRGLEELQLKYYRRSNPYLFHSWRAVAWLAAEMTATSPVTAPHLGNNTPRAEAGEGDEEDPPPRSVLQRMMRAAGKRQREGGEAEEDGEEEMHHGGSFSRYMAMKTRKLHDQYAEQRQRYEAAGGGGGSEGGGIFSGVRIHVNGFTCPPHEELKHIVSKHGGSFENYYSRSTVTHIICNNFSDARIKNIQSER